MIEWEECGEYCGAYRDFRVTLKRNRHRLWGWSAKPGRRTKGESVASVGLWADRERAEKELEAVIDAFYENGLLVQALTNGYGLADDD